MISKITQFEFDKKIIWECLVQINNSNFEYIYSENKKVVACVKAMKGAFQINSWPEIYICAINNMTTRAYEMQKSILQVINFEVPTTIVWV